MSKKGDVELVEELYHTRATLEKELAKVIIGQHTIIEQLLISLLCQGHCLLIGVPGLAKTLLIKTLAQALDLIFKRIQFTPDLMPSDITGTEVIEEDKNSGKRGFRFFKGPIFGNIILADEINRTPPKTQAALLEAMQEHRVTAVGKTYVLEEPFFVLATQNPIEQEGTYPLPEAQLDRFMFSLKVEYPSYAEELEIVKSTTYDVVADIDTVVQRDEIIAFQHLIRRVPVADNVTEFAVKLVTTSRPGRKDTPDFINSWVEWGGGPRASQYLILAAKARALLAGRPTPNIDDVVKIAKPVMRHRIIPNFNAESEGIDTDTITEKLIEHLR
ncbi:MAG: AAA family ATPase [Candidatus Marinimicrobia bacterium]|nr:AAA family ATPase [Candidatus Neomarinimicrobiota bacterium]RKY59843.1 MAG: AAA family ATPase [Candidatus Neomarinimicrobiota bacterium]